MKCLTKTAIFFITLSFSQFAQSVESPTSCETDLFNKLKITEKTGMKLPQRTPGDALSIHMLEYEIICPWRVELDINNDNRKDWVGIVGKQGEYSLMVYLSSKRKYKPINIKTYQHFPSNTYLSFERKNKTFTTDNGVTRKTNRDSFAENNLNGQTILFAWEEKEIKQVLQYTSASATKYDERKEMF